MRQEKIRSGHFVANVSKFNDHVGNLDSLTCIWEIHPRIVQQDRESQDLITRDANELELHFRSNRLY